MASDLEPRFGWCIRRRFCPVRVGRHWSRLSRDDVGVPFGEVSRAGLDGALSKLVLWKVSLPMTVVLD